MPESQEESLEQLAAALALTAQPTDVDNAAAAAVLIVDALPLPPRINPASVAYYRSGLLKAKAIKWLTLVLASEPGMSAETLSARLAALAAVSPQIEREIGIVAQMMQLLLWPSEQATDHPTRKSVCKS